MNWIETQIITASAGVDALCAMLTDLGIKGFENLTVDGNKINGQGWIVRQVGLH